MSRPPEPDAAARLFPALSPSPGASPGTLPPAGWARVRRLSLIRREVREVLAPRALDLLWERREELIEGGREVGCRGRGPAGCFATVMVTLDLVACRGLFHEPADVATATRLAELLHGSAELDHRLIALVRPQLAALAELPEAALEVTIERRIRAEGPRILIDGDAMALPA